MGHVINAGGAFKAHSLEVTFFGVRYSDENAGGYAARRFSFAEIDCVLLSADDRLSFQVKDEVFVVPTSRGNATHQAAIQALVEGVKRSAGETPPPGPAG
jgi:hypothetical protein